MISIPIATPVSLVAVRTPVDLSYTNQGALVSVLNLCFNIGAGTEYTATFDLDIGAALATTGLKLAIVTPAGALLNMQAVLLSASVLQMQRTTVSGTALDFTAASLAGATNVMVRVSVWIWNKQGGAVDGSVLFQIAQSTSSATALTMRAGSNGRVSRIIS